MIPPLLLQASIDTLKERLAERDCKRPKLMPEFKTDLLKELRSGQHHRITGKLIDCDGDCCLMGVAAKVMARRGLVRIDAADDDSSHASCMEVVDLDNGRGDHEIIPQNAASKVGLTSYLQDILSSFNDSTPVADDDMLFVEAANLIEEYL